MARCLTPEEKARKAEIARRNGALSKGPVTYDGKLTSSKNAMKDALCARVHTLSDEDPMEALRLRQRWLDDMKPYNVAEEALVDECYHGHLMSKRYHRAKARALQSQQRDIIEACTRRRQTWSARSTPISATAPSRSWTISWSG
jgi:hypothetical protein